MPQFAVHRNPNPVTRAAIPLLLDVQSELLDTLNTRVVIPLYIPAAVQDGIIATLMPNIEVDGESYIAVTPELAGIPRKSLGAEVGDVSHRRYDIIAALDLLFTGMCVPTDASYSRAWPAPTNADKSSNDAPFAGGARSNLIDLPEQQATGALRIEQFQQHPVAAPCGNAR